MTQATMAKGVVDTTPYNEDIIKKFVLAATFWGVVGFLAGDFIAWQLAFPVLNLDLEWTSVGRLRPVHTTAARPCSAVRASPRRSSGCSSR